MANNTGSCKRACAKFISGSAHFRLVHDSAPISRPIFTNLVRRFILPRTRTSSFGGATGSDWRARA